MSIVIFHRKKASVEHIDFSSVYLPIRAASTEATYILSDFFSAEPNRKRRASYDYGPGLIIPGSRFFDT